MSKKQTPDISDILKKIKTGRQKISRNHSLTKPARNRLAAALHRLAKKVRNGKVSPGKAKKYLSAIDKLTKQAKPGSHISAEDIARIKLISILGKH